MSSGVAEGVPGSRLGWDVYHVQTTNFLGCPQRGLEIEVLHSFRLPFGTLISPNESCGPPPPSSVFGGTFRNGE